MVWKRGRSEPIEDGEQFAEYRIIVDEETKEEDIVRAFRAIKAAYGFRNPGGKPPIDRLTALQCAILYDEHNSVDPDARRCKVRSAPGAMAGVFLCCLRSARIFSSGFHVQPGELA